jgi:hypothetical protein
MLCVFCVLLGIISIHQLDSFFENQLHFLHCQIQWRADGRWSTCQMYSFEPAFVLWWPYRLLWNTILKEVLKCIEVEMWTPTDRNRQKKKHFTDSGKHWCISWLSSSRCQRYNTNKHESYSWEFLYN